MQKGDLYSVVFAARWPVSPDISRQSTSSLTFRSQFSVWSVKQRISARPRMCGLSQRFTVRHTNASGKKHSRAAHRKKTDSQPFLSLTSTYRNSPTCCVHAVLAGSRRNAKKRGTKEQLFETAGDQKMRKTRGRLCESFSEAESAASAAALDGVCLTGRQRQC